MSWDLHVFEKDFRSFLKRKARYLYFNTNEIIIDLETTGVDPKKHHIISAGFYNGKEIKVFFLEEPSNTQKFHQFIKNEVKKLLSEGLSIYAYNSIFEKKFLKIRGIRDLLFYYRVNNPIIGRRYFNKTDPDTNEDIVVGKALMINVVKEAVNSLYDDGILDDKEELQSLIDSYEERENSKIPSWYDKFTRGDSEMKNKIIDHNARDLILEYAILIHFKNFIRKSIIRNWKIEGWQYLPQTPI